MIWTFIKIILFRHACSLISDVLQGGGDVDLLGALHHPVEDHVDEDIGPRPSHSVAAVDDHGARSPPITLVDFPKWGSRNERKYWLSSQRENLFSCFLLTQPIELLMLNLLIKKFNPLLYRGDWWVARRLRVHWEVWYFSLIAKDFRNDGERVIGGRVKFLPKPSLLWLCNPINMTARTIKMMT